MNAQEPPGLINEIIAILAAYDITLRVEALAGDASHHDLAGELRRERSRSDVVVRIKHTQGLADLAIQDQGVRAPLLVAADHVSTRTADALRNAGINYVDASGNAWIRFGDVLIDVRGRKRRAREETDWPRYWPPTHNTDNLFSAGRSQVVCALLAWPTLWDAPTREIAHCAGVSVGLAHGTLGLLRDARYDPDDIVGVRRLLDLWAASFPTGLARRIHLADFRGDVERLTADQETYLGGESAVPDLIRPTTLTVYVRDLQPQLVLANRWRTDGLPNITVRSVFWHAPAGHDQGDAQGEHESEAKAPWPLIYADLFTSEDPRLRTAAEDWRQRFVRA